MLVRKSRGWETEAWELIYFKLYKSQLPVIEQALETAARMLGSDQSRGYLLEMICADFLAGGQRGQRESNALMLSPGHFFGMLPHPQQQEFLSRTSEKRVDI